MMKQRSELDQCTFTPNIMKQKAKKTVVRDFYEENVA